MFDQYNDVTITVQLPEELTITEAMQKEILSGYSNVGSIAGPAEGNVWTFSLKNSIAAQDSDMGSFTFNAFVEGNGAVEVGHEYSYDDLKISISTNFDVLNKVDVTPEVVANYPMTASTDLSGSVEAATQDEWTIQKTTRGTGYTVSEDGKTVTVQFQLAVGLKDSNGNITTQGEAYNRNGRAPFEGNILIKDTLSDVLANDRSTIQPISATLTPQFGEKTPISIGGTDTATDGTEETFNDGSTDIQTALQSLSLPYQTCGKADISDVDKNAPYYSVYYLDITYPYKQFVANYYDANKDAIEIENSAELEYQFKGEETPRAAGPSEASVEIKKETEPAAITISKTIRDREGKETLYSNTTTDWGKVSGSAVFTVKRAGSEEEVSDVKLYTRSGSAENGYTYTVVSNNGTIIIDPKKTSEGTTEGTSISYVTANGTTETLYLDPGNYIITESGRPLETEFYGIQVDGASTVLAKDITNNEYSLSAGETKTLNFINKETLGAVEVTKTGEKGAKLSGAEFTLYGSKKVTDPETHETTEEINEEQPIGTQTTGANGTILFDDLDYGTYWLVETQAPEGYVADSTPIKVVVSAEKGNSLTKVPVANQVNGAQIKLQKRYFNHATGKLEDVNTLTSTFQKVFELQQIVTEDNREPAADAEGWRKVDSANVVLQPGAGSWTSGSLPAYNADGKIIWYRFMETLPAGWTVPEGSETTVTVDGDAAHAYSKPVKLVNEDGTVATGVTEVLMDNTRDAKLTLTKKVVTFSGGKKETRPANADEFTFELYKQIGNQAATKVGEYITNEKGQIVVENLNIDVVKADDGSMQYITYWWVETEKTGYALGSPTAEELTIKEGETEKIVQAIKAHTFSEGTVFEAKTEVTNVEQKALLKIVKEDPNGNFVDGTKITITKQEGGTSAGSFDTYKVGEDGDVVIEKKITSTEEIAIPKDGLLYVVDPGTYIIKEVKCPDNYTPVKPEGYTVTLTATVDSGVTEVPVVNRPDPTLKVNKTVNGKPVSDKVVFTVYTAEEGNDSTFTELMGYDGKTAVTVTSDSNGVQLPAGTYYLKEDSETTPDNALDPNNATYKAFYEDQDKVDTDADGNIYFGPYTVEDNGTIQAVTVDNIENKGGVQGLKVDDDGKALSGATIGIWKKGEETGNPLKTCESTSGTTSQSGANFSFTDLEVYDENDNLITYVIKEIEAPDNYSLSTETIETTLVPETNITKVNGKADGAAIQIQNLHKATFTVTKDYKNIWEYQFTGKTYLLPEVQIALYAREKGSEGSPYYLVYQTADGETVTADKLKDAGERAIVGTDMNGYKPYVLTTSSTGQVPFTSLDQTYDYIAVEVSMPDDGIHTYLEPEGTNKQLLGENTAEGISIPVELKNISAYNTVKRPYGRNTNGELHNEKHWTQLRVYKYADTPEDASLKDEDYKVDETDETPNGRSPVSGSEFVLYKQVLGDNVEESAELTFDLDAAEAGDDGYELVGNYTSGTMQDQETGEVIPGWFATDILDAADNVVYWLYETKAAPGYEIIEEQNPVLFHSKTTSYTNSGKEENACATYTKDEISNYNKPNTPLPGEGFLHSSTIRLNKWIPSKTSEGSYEPLANVTYDIWLTNEDGELIYKIDTVTTGLENEGAESEYKTAMATSFLYYERIREEYAEALYPNADKTGTSLSEDKEKSILLTDRIAYKATATSEGITSAEDGADIVVRMALREVSAPAGYKLDTANHYMYVVYKKAALETAEKGGQHTNTLNDAYYIEVNDDEVPESDSPDGQDTAVAYTYENDDISYADKVRLINREVDNYAVSITKYGYKPENDVTTGKTAEELDDYFMRHSSGREALAGVEMCLQKWTLRLKSGETITIAISAMSETKIR